MVDQLSDLNLLKNILKLWVYTSPKPSNWGFKNEKFYTPFSRLKGLLASWNHPTKHSQKTKALLISLALLGIHLRPPASNVPDIWAKRGGWCSKYTPGNQHGTWKYTLRKGETSTNHQFWGSMLVFGGVAVNFCKYLHEFTGKNNKNDTKMSLGGDFSSENRGF